MLLIYVPFGLWLSFSGLPLFAALLISVFFLFILGRPLEIILNTFFSLFFSLEKDSEGD